MNKTQLTYAQDRIKGISMCMNGKIHTEVMGTIPSEPEKPGDLTKDEMYNMITSGSAVLEERKNLGCCDYIWQAYSYPEYEKAVKKFEKSHKTWEIKNKKALGTIEERQHEVELEGKRIVDDFVLGLIKPADLPDRLEEFSGTQF